MPEETKDGGSRRRPASTLPALLLGVTLAIVPLVLMNGPGGLAWCMDVLGVRNLASPLLAGCFAAWVVLATAMACFLPALWLGVALRNMGQARLSLGQWLAGMARIALGALAVAVVMAEAIWCVYRFAVPLPWLWLALLWTLLVLLAAGRRGRSDVPLGQAEDDRDRQLILRQRLLARARRLGVAVAGIDVRPVRHRTGAANAMVWGIGNRPRVVLTDSLLGVLDDDEIEAIFVHELAHVRAHDPQRFLAIRIAVACCAFLFAYPLTAALGNDLPPLTSGLIPYLVALLETGYLARAAFYNLRRRRELAADRFVYDTLGDTAVFQAAIAKLHSCSPGARQHRAWLRVLSTHPALARRRALALAWQAQRLEGRGDPLDPVGPAAS